SRHRKGTGIGLYVVRSIIHAHGGKVTVSSDGPDQGATFTIRLPAILSSATVKSQSERAA
ncbi:MAG: ATP-binding protein, partial [Acidobacteriota bacterium]